MPNRENYPEVGDNPTDSNLQAITQIAEEMAEDLTKERQLAQFLGLSLRAVMPATERGLLSMIAMSATSPDDKSLNQRVELTNQAFQRAQHALDLLDGCHLSVEMLPDDHFDEHFEVKFEE